MSLHKITHKRAWFRKEGTGCTQIARPVLSDPDLIGEVTTYGGTKEPNLAVFEKVVNGIRTDYDVRAQTDKEEMTLVVGEYSPLAVELVRGTSVSLVGGAASYVPGDHPTMKGWLRVQLYEDDSTVIDDCYFWVYISIPTYDHPQDGFQSFTFNVKKLHSTEVIGAFSNIL